MRRGQDAIRQEILPSERDISRTTTRCTSRDISVPGCLNTSQEAKDSVRRNQPWDRERLRYDRMSFEIHYEQRYRYHSVAQDFC